MLYTVFIRQIYASFDEEIVRVSMGACEGPALIISMLLSRSSEGFPFSNSNATMWLLLCI